MSQCKKTNKQILIAFFGGWEAVEYDMVLTGFTTTHVYVCMCAFMYVYACMNMYVSIYACMYVYLCM